MRDSTQNVIQVQWCNKRHFPILKLNSSVIKMKKLLRIGLPVVFLAIAGIYLSSAAYSVWVSGTPPNGYPEAWAYRSFRHLFYGIGFIIFATTAFISLKADAKRIKVTCIIGIIIALSLFSTPHMKKFLEIDGCLDQGGRWNEAYHRCEK